jgi:hypothetical protein
MPSSSAWRAFNLLSSAVANHQVQAQRSAFHVDNDRALYAERRRILREIASRPDGSDEISIP